MAKPKTPTPSTTTLIVTADGLNVRDTPSLQGTVVGSLSNGDIVDWLDSSGDDYWRKIKKGSLTGWASHKYLTPQVQNAPAGGRPWLSIAYGEVGVKEIAGSGSNPRIIEYLHSTNLGAPDNNRDETAWCSAFVNWCVERSGRAGTDSAAALSWASWGNATSLPIPGDIVVFNWGGGHGHVGFFVSASATMVKVLGGNQSNEVDTKDFNKNLVFRFRQPA